MIFLILFTLVLSIYEIYYVVNSNNDKKKEIITIYIVMSAIVLIIGRYYYSFDRENSISYIIFRILNITY